MSTLMWVVCGVGLWIVVALVVSLVFGRIARRLDDDRSDDVECPAPPADHVAPAPPSWSSVGPVGALAAAPARRS